MVVAVLSFGCIALAGSSYEDDRRLSVAYALWEEILGTELPETGVYGHLMRAAACVNTGQLEPAFSEFSSVGDVPGQKQLAQDLLTQIENDTLKLPSGQSTPEIVDLNLAAVAYYTLTEFDEAAGCFRAILEQDPRNIWIMHLLSVTLARLERWDEAIETLQRALEVSPRNEYTHLLLSMAYYKKGSYLRAAYHYLKAPDARRQVGRYLGP